MQLQKPKIPPKHRPQGFVILHEDKDIIIVNKHAGKLSVAALWNKDSTVHSDLNHYIRKGNPKATKVVYVVHRLDQATSGVMIFAKSEEAQQFLKDNWQKFKKNYVTIVHGQLKEKSGLIESFLEEDDDYHVHSSQDSQKGKLARTEYSVLKETDKFSAVHVNLLTGKKNQIRVHMAELGHPVVGDAKYGPKVSRFKDLMLHSCFIEFIHPYSKKPVVVTCPLPERFHKIMDFTDFKITEFSKT
ncbi:MAG: pseudouridylate synthase [Pseudobdellovibrio sp.]|nr:pseudouridylate synthase [Pseudobdellovibrio sp.]